MCKLFKDFARLEWALHKNVYLVLKLLGEGGKHYNVRMVIEQLEAAFHPRSIAVVGASGNPFSMGYRYVLHLISYGYRG